jgi:hypothetical protein
LFHHQLHFQCLLLILNSLLKNSVLDVRWSARQKIDDEQRRTDCSRRRFNSWQKKRKN